MTRLLPLTVANLHELLGRMLERGVDPDSRVLLAIPMLDADDDADEKEHQALACSIGGTDEDDERAQVVISAFEEWTFI